MRGGNIKISLLVGDEVLKFKNKVITIKIDVEGFELNVLKLLELNFISSQDILLPVIDKNNRMRFFPWKKNDGLFIKRCI